MAKVSNLTLVDFQNDFVAPNGQLTFDDGVGDTKLIKRMTDFFKRLPIGYFDNAIVTYDTHNPDTFNQTDEGKQFPLHCAIGTNGWNLAINPSLISDKILKIQTLKKDTYDMWRGHPESVHPEIYKAVQEVVLVGIASDICNKAALDGWLKRGVSVIIIEDLTRGIFKQTPEVVAAKEYAVARQTGKLRTMTMHQFFNHIQKQR